MSKKSHIPGGYRVTERKSDGTIENRDVNKRSGLITNIHHIEKNEKQHDHNIIHSIWGYKIGSRKK